MKTTFPNTIIELTPEEAIDVYYDIKRGLESTIDTHWVNYPDSYAHGEVRRLNILYHLNRSVGHDQDVLQQMRERLTDAVKKRTSPTPTGGER